MQITSIVFFAFICVLIIIYFTFPPKHQWKVLLIASCIFYFTYGIKSFVFILFTSISVFIAASRMQQITDAQKAYLKSEGRELSREEKSIYKKKNSEKKKHIMLAALLANIAVLAVFKYLHFTIDQLNSLSSWFNGPLIDNSFSLLVPLGISFYTFQMTGYLLDVYWGNVRAEQNYFKVLLFCVFFPQITQGPISEFEQLSAELFTGHSFEYRNYSWGMQRMAWGFFKKMVVADAFAPYVNDVFANYHSYSGITTLIGAFMYSIQIYADFSGYMDIMCGLCEVMGIHLTENFERPYFSKSVAEYWRRWHISLGAWFKRYIYYPIGISRWNRDLGKKSRELFGRKFGDMLPASVALVIVWFATGLWHGASWAYIVWGLVNGLFIILTLWLDPFYEWGRKKLGVNEFTPWWRVVQIIRTFILITFIKVLPEVGTLSDGLGLWKNILCEHTIPSGLQALLPFLNWYSGITIVNFLMGCIGTVMMFIISVMQRRRPVRSRTEKWPLMLRVFVFSAVFMLIIIFGVQNSWEGGGFLYAQF